MSIVDEAYRERYRGEGDWFKQLVDAECYYSVIKTTEEIQEDGTVKTIEKTTAKRRLDVERLFDLATENGIEEERLTKFREIVGTNTSEGRIRMSVGNMLRAKAKKEGGLKVNGTFVKAPEEFLPKAEEDSEQEAA